MNAPAPSDVRNDATAPPRAPWREPMLWLVVALPAAVVVAGIATLLIAVRAGGSDAIPDHVRRTAQVQVADLDADARAQARDLAALLRIDGGQVQVLPVSGDFARDRPLRLALRHPTRASEDRALQLAPQGPGWATRATLDRGHDWRLELGPGDGSWRLRGRLPARQNAVRLSPALGD